MNRLRNLARQKLELETGYDHNLIPAEEYSLWLSLATPYLMRYETLDWSEADKLGILAWRMLVKAFNRPDDQAVA